MITEGDIKKAFRIGQLTKELIDLGVPKGILAPIKEWLKEYAKKKELTQKEAKS